MIKYARKIKFLKDLTILKPELNIKLFLNSFLTLCIWLCYSLIALIILYSMNIYNIPFYFLFFAVCLANVIVLIPITPNGWGLREGTYVFLFSQFTKFTNADTSLVFSIILVLLSTYFLALIGLILEFTKFRKH